MSFLYRPTPVIVLSGKTVGTDHVPLRGLPAGTMHGYTPNKISPRLNAIGRRTISGNPWLISSGTMGSFLGQEDLTPPDIFGPIDVPPVDFGSLTPPAPFDYSGAFASPFGPTPSMIPPAAPIAPDIGSSIGPAGPLLPVQPPVAPRPPTQAVAQPAVAQAGIAAGTSILTSIANFFKPTVKATPMTAATPGVYQSTTTTPSWFGQSTVVPGFSNVTVLLLGAALVLLIPILGSKEAVGRR